jgi:hypothetical protein
MKLKSISLVAFAIAMNACYHATVDTGRTPSPQVIEKPWASGWIYGLVPPSTVETAQKCPNGVAKVETQLSFANQIVNFLTIGIYTPMAIRVTCAQAGGTATLPVINSGNNKGAAIETAAQLSVQRSTAVIVKF